MRFSAILFAAQLAVSKRLFHQQHLFQDTSLDLGDWIAPSSPSSGFVTHSVHEKPGSTGKQNKWNVFKHSAFPRYSLRTKEEVKLCDPNVKQVSYTLVFSKGIETYSIDCRLFRR
jgi:hypothetical protein